MTCRTSRRQQPRRRQITCAAPADRRMRLLHDMRVNSAGTAVQRGHPLLRDSALAAPRIAVLAGTSDHQPAPVSSGHQNSQTETSKLSGANCSKRRPAPAA